MPGTRLDLSADWFVQVFRDGLAFVADTPGLMGTTHARLREYVRSIYLDVFLLTRIQMAALASLAGELSESDLRRWTAEALDSLEADQDFLLKGDVFSKDQIEAYIEKLTGENDAEDSFDD